MPRIWQVYYVVRTPSEFDFGRGATESMIVAEFSAEEKARDWILHHSDDAEWQLHELRVKTRDPIPFDPE